MASAAKRNTGSCLSIPWFHVRTTYHQTDHACTFYKGWWISAEISRIHTVTRHAAADTPSFFYAASVLQIRFTHSINKKLCYSAQAYGSLDVTSLVILSRSAHFHQNAFLLSSRASADGEEQGTNYPPNKRLPLCVDLRSAESNLNLPGGHKQNHKHWSAMHAEDLIFGTQCKILIE